MQQLYKFGSAIFVFLISIVATQVQAQESNNNTVNITTTAVPFLRISPDARSGGMGDAGIALSPDANSGFYNLAKTPFATDRSGIGATYTPWLKEIADDMYLATLAGYHKLSDNEALSASLRYFSMGDLTLVDFNGNKLQTTNPREMAIDLGYSRKLSDRLGIAVALRYIHSNLSTGSINGVSYKAGNTVAGDLSIFYNGLNEKSAGWAAGLSLSNLGGKINYTDNSAEKDFLPANLGIGAGYTEVWDDNNKMTFAADINKLLVPELPNRAEDMKAYRDKGVFGSWFDSFGNQAWQFGFGMEYTYNDQLHLRLGYNSKTYESGNWQNITAGAGIHFSFATINFSYLVPTGEKINRNPLTNTVRFGILFGWR
ncbi:hypothetical protein D3H65_10520 [Paraflavitalea soli]|uniref:Type IX secretion system protein PorV domain-containing protein n=1 Tax=Paraflavitalea soli TaxID=2315862 RepID=A0A3B7MVU0_9BACT|nr:type IX secretion system outer membrane channel protein PorV [Paraflavitalea soli]AXY78594.1 hypothetical protein D3H65_10520 [Paraflavitalea soli]